MQVLRLASALCGLSVCCSMSMQAQTMPGMDHHHHHAMDSTEQLGAVSFPTSCSATAQPEMVRGVALLHSFGYTLAKMQFEQVAKDDPSCAMAHWGLAMTDYQELWGQPDAESIKAGTADMQKARALEAGPETVTARERGYIDALSTFFQPGKAPFQQRADGYVAKMNALHKAYPGDVEAAAFDALALIASVPPGDTSLRHEHEALAILVPLFAAHPDHPGLAHYIIHTCDTPALAPEGLAAAREYAKIAPSSPHALHMPGHIFARLGMWQEDIASNLASVKASKQDEAEHKPGAAHQMHADEFLIYAYLQTGQDEKARALNEQMPAISKDMASMSGMDDMKDEGPYFANELNAVYNVEMHHWQEAKSLQPISGSAGWSDVFTWWGRGIGAGHLQDVSAATAALAGLDKDIASVNQTPQAAYMANGLAIKRNELLAWQAYAQHNQDAAVAAMTRAADLQDKLGQGEVDIPAREMLGDILLLEHKPKQALDQYRVALKLSPNRLNGLMSAGKAAAEAGMPQEARTYFEAAAKQTDDGKFSSRPDVAYAVKMAGGDTVASVR